MRTLTAGAQAEIAKKTGTAPQFILEIQWTEAGSIFSYADTEVSGIPGVINSIDVLDNAITISGVQAGTTSDSQSLGVVLNDSEGQVKAILDQNDIHKRPVWVYQWFEGLPLTDKFLLFKGQVSSPLEWNERDRTVSFTVINRVEDAEIGFSVEEGDFPLAPQELVGKAWPLCFGRCINIPALELVSPFKGTLLQGFVIRDFTLEAKLDQLKHMCCPLVDMGLFLRGTIGGQTAQTLFAPEPGCYCRQQDAIAEFTAEIAAQAAAESNTTTIKILNGEAFRQGKTITLDVCGAKITGQFTGTEASPTNTFVIQKRVHPKFGTLTIPPTKLYCDRLPPSVAEAINGSPIYDERPEPTLGPTSCVQGDPDRTETGWDYLATFPDADHFWAEPGCDVFLDNGPDVVYAVNLLPSTILNVSAWRTFDNGVRQLISVPSSLYSSRVSDFNGYMVQELVFPTRLSRLEQGWEDDIYVSFDSSVGPNVVDIMEWLIGKYAPNLTWDTSNFDAIKSQLTVYRNSTPFLERVDLFDALQTLAFNNRLAIVLRNDEFKLIYLPDPLSADFTITESDIVPGSLTIGHTPTEQLVTQFTATWQDDYAKNPKKFITRYNVKRYGTQKQEFDFPCFNIFDWVQKSSTFWLIRMGNTWRKLKFKTYLTKLEAEVFDVAAVTLADFAPGTVNCIVEQAAYDADTNTIDFELWTPIRSGEQVPFEFANPAAIEVTKLWPTAADLAAGIAGGSGPNVDVTPPASHPLNVIQGYNSVRIEDVGNCSTVSGLDFAGRACRPDHGDQQPSDIDDTDKQKSVKGAGQVVTLGMQNVTGGIDKSKFFEKVNGKLKEIESNVNNVLTRTTEVPGGGSTSSSAGDDLQKALDDLPNENPLDDCYAVVEICHEIVGAVIKPDGSTDKTPGAVGADKQGDIASTDLGCERLTFNSLQLAFQYLTDLRKMAASYSATVGGQWMQPSPLTGLKEVKWGANCEEPENPGIVAYSRPASLVDTAATLGHLNKEGAPDATGGKYVDKNGNDVFGG